MAKTVTSKNQKTVVADNSTVAATQEAVATEEVAAMENGTVDVEAQEVEATTTETTEIIGTDPDGTDAGNTESGLPFTVGSDGLVEVVSIKRAGKSVCGTTGEIVTFDENGKAKVSIEDALHFQQVPGFDFK
mgnify:FL=1